MKKYYDKNGTLIKAGDTLRHVETNELEVVYACGDNDLGFNATNHSSPNATRDEAYPLFQFNLDEYEIVHNIKEDK